MIHVMRPQLFLIGIYNGSSITHVKKSEAFSPRRSTTIQSTQTVASDGYVYIKIKKVMYSLKQAALLAYSN